MESFSLLSLLGRRAHAFFSLGVLAGSALVGVLILLLLFGFFGRLLRNSKSTLRLVLLKQTRSQVALRQPIRIDDAVVVEGEWAAQPASFHLAAR